MSNTNSWFLNIDEAEQSRVSDSKALRISKVAPQSPAAELGLQPGDLFISINGKAALNADVVDLLLRSKKAVYVFHLTKTKKRLTVKTQALPLGFKTDPTSNAIVDKYKKGKRVQGFDGIMSLWERGDYAHLKLVGKYLSGRGALGKLKALVSKHPLTSLIDAICEIEDGEAAQGYAALDDFEQNHMKFFTSDIGSLVEYYQAKKVEKTDDKTFRSRMQSVMASNQDSDRMVALAEQYEIGYVEKGQRIGTAYDFDWEMKSLVGPSKAVMAASFIKELKPGQVLPICLMVSYRGNGPYSDAMKVYHAMYPHVKDSLLPMFVMTSDDQKRPDRPHWYDAEDALVKADIPITVAHDPNAYFADSFLTGAPEFIGLDHSGKVVWDAYLGDAYDYWVMLSRVKTA